MAASKSPKKAKSKKAKKTQGQATAPKLSALDAAAKVLADPATVSRTEHKLQKFAKLLDGNPRTTKRFVNTFTVIEAIRTLETEIIDFDTLALWSIIRVRWPEVADYLQREPAALPLRPVHGRRHASAVHRHVVLPPAREPPGAVRR